MVCYQQHQTLWGIASESKHSSNDKIVAGVIFPTVNFFPIPPPQTHRSLQSSDKSFGLRSAVHILHHYDKAHITSLSQDTYTWNDKPVAATPVTSYYAKLSPPLLITFKLHPHFWKQFTLFARVTQHNESTSTTQYNESASVTKHNESTSVAQYSESTSVAQHNESTSLQPKYLPSCLLYHDICYQACW